MIPRLWDESQLPFLAEKGHVVSLVGGGGKSTLLAFMAEQCAARGWRVLVGTTTHIRRPERERWAQTDAELADLWARGSYAVVGTAADDDKLTAAPPALMAHWMSMADIMLLEADGAKRLPCKAPAAHEPVLLPESDVVLAVAGLSAVGCPLAEVCFRLETACTLLDASPATIVTPPLLARLLASEAGGRKAVGERRFYAVLNQADDAFQCACGEKIRSILRDEYGVRAVLTSFEAGGNDAKL